MIYMAHSRVYMKVVYKYGIFFTFIEWFTNE